MKYFRSVLCLFAVLNSAAAAEFQPIYASKVVVKMAGYRASASLLVGGDFACFAIEPGLDLNHDLLEFRDGADRLVLKCVLKGSYISIGAQFGLDIKPQGDDITLRNVNGKRLRDLVNRNYL